MLAALDHLPMLFRCFSVGECRHRPWIYEPSGPPPFAGPCANRAGSLRPRSFCSHIGPHRDTASSTILRLTCCYGEGGRARGLESWSSTEPLRGWRIKPTTPFIGASVGP